ncbi:hypothetical protein WMY93_003106 [Mugilogobius chulae]|uniref:Neurotransmitter-gated ion-channel ligand-binding domain-containing protein n=1 Tax=Mugilogobius chulae TaxID=88201 RepID=A0AAW0PXC3_9GOBI
MHLEVYTTLLYLLLIEGAEPTCTTRRCLAEMLIKKNLKSQPQYENCSTVIDISYLEYQTLAVDTKNLRLVSRLHATFQWIDPELSWNTSLYEYDEVSLPIETVWTPELLVTNAILIILADVVSFALPLGGGERNSFKVTLVLSFTMFLVILNGELPGDSQCSPVIRTHFCVCLVILVLSMLVSMVLTQSSPDISVVQTEPAEENTQMLRKVVNFLQALDAKEQESDKYEQFANILDKSFFWIYFVFSIAYFIGMFYVMTKHVCVINHFDFWE